MIERSVIRDPRNETRRRFCCFFRFCFRFCESHAAYTRSRRIFILRGLCAEDIRPGNRDDRRDYSRRQLDRIVDTLSARRSDDDIF